MASRNELGRRFAAKCDKKEHLCNSGSTMWFRSDVMYSYGVGIAERYLDKDGDTLVVYDTRRYSATTDRHQYAVIYATQNRCALYMDINRTQAGVEAHIRSTIIRMGNLERVMLSECQSPEDYIGALGEWLAYACGIDELRQKLKGLSLTAKERRLIHRAKDRADKICGMFGRTPESDIQHMEDMLREGNLKPAA